MTSLLAFNALFAASTNTTTTALICAFDSSLSTKQASSKGTVEGTHIMSSHPLVHSVAAKPTCNRDETVCAFRSASERQPFGFVNGQTRLSCGGSRRSIWPSFQDRGGFNNRNTSPRVEMPPAEHHEHFSNVHQFTVRRDVVGRISNGGDGCVKLECDIRRDPSSR